MNSDGHHQVSVAPDTTNAPILPLFLESEILKKETSFSLSFDGTAKRVMIAVYPDAIIVYSGSKITIPSEAAALNGSEQMMLACSKGESIRLLPDEIKKVEISKWIKTRRELVFLFINRADYQLTIVGLDSVHLAEALKAILPGKIFEDVEPRARPYFSVRGAFGGLILGMMLFGLAAYYFTQALGRSFQDIYFLSVPIGIPCIVAGGILLGRIRPKAPNCQKCTDGIPPQLQVKIVPKSLGKARPIYSRKLAWSAKILGVVLIAFGIGVIFFDLSQLIGSLLLLLFESAGLGLLITGYRLGLRSGTKAMALDPRPPIFFLRSFTDDGRHNLNPEGQTASLLGMQDIASTPYGLPLRFLRMAAQLFFSCFAGSAEEQLAPFFRKMGPFVTFGRPGERLAHGGAERVYTEAYDWKDQVKNLISRSQVIVLQPAETDGVWWELVEAIKNTPPENLLLNLINYKKSSYDYNIFRTKLAQKTKIQLPPSLEGCFFVCFDRDWQPKLLPLYMLSPVWWPISRCGVDFTKTFEPWLAIRQRRDYIPARSPGRLYIYLTKIFALIFWYIVVMIIIMSAVGIFIFILMHLPARE